MSVRTTLLTAATVLATLAGAAQAEPIKARAGGSVSLGDVAGVAYYTPETTGYRVVVTLAGTESAGPVRFESVLAIGQSGYEFVMRCGRGHDDQTQVSAKVVNNPQGPRGAIKTE